MYSNQKAKGSLLKKSPSRKSSVFKKKKTRGQSKPEKLINKSRYKVCMSFKQQAKVNLLKKKTKKKNINNSKFDLKL